MTVIGGVGTTNHPSQYDAFEKPEERPLKLVEHKIGTKDGGIAIGRICEACGDKDWPWPYKPYYGEHRGLTEMDAACDHPEHGERP